MFHNPNNAPKRPSFVVPPTEEAPAEPVVNETQQTSAEAPAPDTTAPYQAPEITSLSEAPVAQSTSPTSVPKAECDWTLGMHLSTFSGGIFPAGNILGPLIIWMIKRDTMPFLSQEAKNCINFQISMTIYLIISTILCLFFVGFFFIFVIVVLDLVCTIQAAIRGSAGKSYRYPFTIQFIK